MLKNEPSITAKVCAFARAHHSKYAGDKIFDDYLAYDLLGKSEYDQIKDKIVQIVSDQNWQIPELESFEDFLDELVSPIILSRIKYAEDLVMEYAATEKTLQYVICGAGMDSFAFRNEDPNIEIFELDHPNTHKYKLERIKELGWTIPSNVHFIEIDFEKQNMKDVLLEGGFAPKVKTLFAILGVTYYLELNALGITFENMSALTENESLILLDYPDKEILNKDKARMQVLKDITNGFGEKMKGGMSFEELKSELQINEFQILKHYDKEAIQKAFITGNKLKAYENVNFITAIKQVKQS